MKNKYQSLANQFHPRWEQETSQQKLSDSMESIDDLVLASSDALSSTLEHIQPVTPGHSFWQRQ